MTSDYWNVHMTVQGSASVEHYYVIYLLHGAESFLEANWIELVKKFSAFHGTRRFITAHTSVIYIYI